MTINFQISLGPWNLKILLKFSAQRIFVLGQGSRTTFASTQQPSVYLSSNKDAQQKERWPSKQVSKKGLRNYSLAARTRWPYKSGDETLRPDWPPRFLIYDPNFAFPQSYLPRYFCSWKTAQVYTITAVQEFILLINISTILTLLSLVHRPNNSFELFFFILRGSRVFSFFFCWINKRFFVRSV